MFVEMYAEHNLWSQKDLRSSPSSISYSSMHHLVQFIYTLQTSFPHL